MRTGKEKRPAQKVQYEADDEQLVQKIQALRSEERNAIAVCSYHPIDKVTFNPNLEAPMYRRSDAKHPFFEINYSIDVYTPPTLTTIPYQHVYLLGEVSDEAAAQLQDLESAYHATERKAPKSNFILCYVDKANKNHFLHIDGSGKKTDLDRIADSLRPLLEREGPLKKGKGSFTQSRALSFTELVPFLPDSTLLKTELVVLKIKQPDRNNITKALENHTNSCILILDESGLYRFLRYRGVSRAQNKDFDFDTSTQENEELSKGLEALPKDVQQSSLNQVISKTTTFIDEKTLNQLIVQPINEALQTNIPDPATKKIRIVVQDGCLIYRFIGVDGKSYQGNLGNKENFLIEGSTKYNEDAIKKAVGQHALQKQVASENATFEQLKAYFDAESSKVQKGTGLNPQVIGGKKGKAETMEADLKPLVNQADSEPLKRLEDAILNHKTTIVEHIVSLISAQLPTPDSAVKINTNQKMAHYPCVIVHFNLEYWSTFKKTTFSEKALGKITLADVGTYHVSKKNDQYQIEYVSFEKGKPVTKKLALKESERENFLAYMHQVETEPAHAAKWERIPLRNFVEEPLDIPNRSDYPALTHLLIAFINYELYQNQQGNYFDRRDSFGFLTPTATDVGSAVRLSLGLVPNQNWEHCLVTGTKKFNEFLTLYAPNNKRFLNDINSYFAESHLQAYGHKVFLEQLVQSSGDFSQMADFFNRLSSKKEVEELCKRYDELNAFKELSTMINKKGKNSEATPLFLKLYQAVDEVYNHMFANLNIKPSSTTKEADSVHQKMQNLRNKIDDFRWQSYLAVQTEEEKALDISSTSEEDEKPEEKMHKYYTPSGMSALALPLIIYGLHTQTKPVPFHLLPYAYFELQQFRTYFKEALFQEVTKSTDASVLFYDNNPCVTGFDENPVDFKTALTKFLADGHPNMPTKLVIVDITSSTLAQQQEILEIWKKYGGNHILCFAQSALKNRQLSLDMAHYGIMKVFCTDPENQLYQTMQKDLSQISAQTASAYATTMRRELRAAAQYLNVQANAPEELKGPGKEPHRYSFFQQQEAASTTQAAEQESNKLSK